MENWLPIIGYEDYYEVSDRGRVRGLDRIVPHARYGTVQRRGKLLTPRKLSKFGHVGVSLCRDGEIWQVHIHVLVLEAFVGPCPRGWECRHLNGDPSDNRVENLTWGTRKENSADRVRHGHLTCRDDVTGRWTGVTA